MRDHPGETALRTMEALAILSDTTDVAAHLVGTIYELAMRQGETPRTIADKAFCNLLPDEQWRTTLEPALRDVLGRD